MVRRATNKEMTFTKQVTVCCAASDAGHIQDTRARNHRTTVG